MKRFVLALVVSIGALATATTGPGDVSVEHAWARAMPKGAAAAAASVTLINDGSSDDRVVSAASPVAETVQLDSMTDGNGVMKMEELPTLEVHAGSTLALNRAGSP